MEQRVLNTCQASIDPTKPLSLQCLPSVRSLITNPHTSDSTISSLLQTLTRSLQLTTTTDSIHLYTLKLLSDLASFRPHLSPLILSSLLSADSALASVDSLSAIISISGLFKLDDSVFASLCFGQSISARVWLIRNAERLCVGSHVLLTVCMGFAKDPYPYVREAALDGLVAVCKSGGFEDLSVIEGCYNCGVESLRDGEDCVRAAGVRVVREWGRMLIAMNPEKDKRDCWADVVFLQLCSTVRDMSVEVRIEAFDALGSVQWVSEDILWQTLSKKVLSIIKERKSDGRRTAERLEILASSAAGAFVHGLEDEFFEVRKSACHSLRMLSVLSAKFADQAVNFLMDLLNDDAMVVRLEVLEALHHVATFDCLKVPEIHRHMFLGTLLDINNQIRFAARKIFKVVKLPNLELFRLSINSLLKVLEKYPQDEADVFSVLFYMGQKHGAFAARIIKEVSQEIEPVSEGKLIMDSVRVAAFLVLAISAPLSRDQKGQNIPPRLFSYAVTFLGRIFSALSEIVDQNTLLVYLCQGSRSDSSGMETEGEEIKPAADDDVPGLIGVSFGQPGYKISDFHSPSSCLSKDTVKSFIKCELEKHNEVMKSINLILATVKDMWWLVQSRYIREALRTLRVCKEQLATISPTSAESVGAQAFILHYLQAMKLLAKILEMLWKAHTSQTTKLEIVLGKLETKLRELRCIFIGLSKEEEMHILELVLVTCVVRLSKMEMCTHVTTMRNLSATMSRVEFLHKEGSIEQSNFVKEVKKVQDKISESVVDTSYQPLPFEKLVHLFSTKQFQFHGRVRQIKAELDILDNDSINPLCFVPGLPVGIRLLITLHNVVNENRLWLTLRMNEVSTQFVFLDLNLIGGFGEVKKFPFTATFYATPKVGSFTLRVCIGMECLFEDACLIKGCGGPKHAKSSVSVQMCRYILGIIHLASMVDIVSEFPVYISDDDELVAQPLSVKNPGSLGWGNTAPSISNMKTTDDIVGLS